MPLFKDLKIAKTLQQLDENEFKSFGKWLQSPWCNSNKKLFPIYEEIKSHFPDFDHPRLSRESIGEKLNIDDRSLVNLFTMITKQVKKFVTFQQLEQDEALQSQLLARDYEARKDSKTSVNTLEKQYEKITLSEEVISTKTHATLFQISDSIYFQSRNNRYESPPDYLYRAIQHLDIYYLLFQFRYLQELKFRENILQKSEDAEQKFQALKVLAADSKHPAVTLYLQFLDSKKIQSRPHFLSLQGQFKQSLPLLALTEKSIFFLSLTNYANQLNLQGETAALQDLFDLYQYGLEKELLIYKGKISGITFFNILQAASLLGKVDYIEQFVKQYASFLPAQEYQEASLWAEGLILYCRQQHTNCQQLLNRSFKNRVYEIQAKMTILKSHFDELLSDRKASRNSFEKYCLAFEKFLQRGDMYSFDRKGACINLVQYVKRLALSYKSSVIKKDRIEKIKEQIKINKNTYGKSWLLQKANYLLSLE